MKKIFLVTCLVIVSSVILPLKNYALDELREEVKIYVGEPKILSVSNPTRIAIGNPSIADVTQVTKSEITLSPKAAGTTTLVIWDNFGEQSYKIKVLPEDMQEIKHRVDSLLGKLGLPEVYTQTAEEEGKVILLGRVKTPQDRERISTALGALKDKTVDLILVKEEEAVIEIDVQVLELNKDATTSLGLAWPSSFAVASDADADGKNWFLDVSESSPAVTRWPNFFKITQWSRTNFYWKLDALVMEGKARILSRPRLACQSGKEAELMVGGEKPIFATYTSETGTGATVEYKEYGIKLKIKPTVTEEKRIKLGLNMEVSEVESPETIGSTTATIARAYPLKKRNASTELFLNDGQTLAIGGLMKQKKEEDLQKVPGLGDIPILGFFFRKKTTKMGGGTGERGDTELFIALTPTIVTDKEEKAARPKKKIKSKLAVGIGLSQQGITSKSEPVQKYASVVQARILDNLTYPNSAKEAGFQGAVKLGLRISYSGELLDVSVKSSSGYKILDDNAVSVAQGIASYPPFPSSIDQKELSIEIPIVYQLD